MKARNPIDGLWYYFVDKCLPFGSSISCAHFQDFSNSVAHIVRFYTKRECINYLDDYLFVALMKAICDGQVEVFLDICRIINFPVSLEKTFWGTTRGTTFLGLLIDTVKQLVCIPVEKIDRANELICQVLQKKNKKITVHQLQRLCGYLNFICRAVVPGRAFTRRLYAYTATKKGVLKPCHHIRVNSEMRADLTLWKIFLGDSSAYCRPFIDFNKTQSAVDIDMFTDASRNFKLGFGGYCDNEFFCHRWCKFTKQVGPSIEYLEFYAVTVAVLLWLYKFANSRIRLFCDNKSVVDMINSSSSGCKNCMYLIRVLTLEGLKHNVRIFAKHVRTRFNDLADFV